MIRGIVFDLFDTLVDQNHDRLAPVEIRGQRVGGTTPALHARVLERTGTSIDVLDFADLLRSVDRALRVDTFDQGIELSTLDRFAALATRMGVSDVLGLASELTAIHMSALRAAVTVPVHHEAILTGLAVEHRLGLCSNFTHAPTARDVLRDAHIEDRFDAIVISDEVGIRKPRREIFEAVVDGLGLAPEEILHVGDSLEADVAGAAAIGMRTVWLTRCVRDPEATLADFEGPRPDFALDDLLDLPVLAARLG